MSGGAKMASLRPVPRVDEIIVAVMGAYPYLTFADLRSRRVERHITTPRHIAMALAREMIPMSFPQIGMCFRRDHTTAIHACRSIAAHASSDRNFKRHIETIRKQVLAIMFDDGRRRDRYAARTELLAARGVAALLVEFGHWRNRRDWLRKLRRRPQPRGILIYRNAA